LNNWKPKSKDLKNSMTSEPPRPKLLKLRKKKTKMLRLMPWKIYKQAFKKKESNGNYTSKNFKLSEKNF